jgi:hypothetical protein
VEHAAFFLEILGEPMWQQTGGGVVHHDMRPLSALHRVDRRQRDSIRVAGHTELLGKPGGKATRVGLEVRQLAKRIKVVAVRRNCAVAPSVEGRCARVQSAGSDLRSEHRKNVGRRPRLGRLSDLPQVLCETP